ncbi:MAG TPA: 3D domain-containing protein [Polyangiaceae bacterium]|nr:3D domain-containing protein [Polyangiaceae bacterium]
MAQPLPNESWEGEATEPDAPQASQSSSPEARPRARIIGERERTEANPEVAEAGAATPRLALQGGGRSLGTFRNTYYDFPSEADFDGAKVPIKSARCETLAEVPRGFFESVCVQGSGTLRSGATVSFAKRDCACAEICPRTDQKICFDSLDPAAYPWGRGATGKAITPLLTVAVDTDVIPLGTALYVPELDGIPRDDAGTTHDGCFIAQDRGVRVKGKHVDFFTGHASLTALWNRLVPSNKGVTVVLESPRCARAAR